MSSDSSSTSKSVNQATTSRNIVARRKMKPLQVNRGVEPAKKEHTAGMMHVNRVIDTRAHGEVRKFERVHYPCGLGTMNSDSVRAEVHYPEGFDRGLTLCDQKCQFGFYTKRVSATVGYLPG